jgi:S-adenosylmethionine hydrolase
MDPTRTVAVVSDFGVDSFYVGAMKAALYYAAPACNVVDVTHSITPHAIAQGSFVLDTVFDFYPPGSVFLTVVDPGVGGERRNLAALIGDRYWVGPDNGLLTEVVARVGDARAWVIDEAKIDPLRARFPVGRTFLGRDVFAPAAGALVSDREPSDVGEPADGPLVAVEVAEVNVGPGQVSAVGRYVDSFGNILTGITGNHLRSAFGGVVPEDIHVDVDGHAIGTLCTHYSQHPSGTLMAVVNSWDRIEIAVSRGRAINRCASSVPEEIKIELSPQKASGQSPQP